MPEPNEKDFPAPTKYEQTYIRNDSWSNTTTTRTDPDGTVTQVSYIHPTRGKK